jgi:hypothetical protein
MEIKDYTSPISAAIIVAPALMSEAMIIANDSNMRFTSFIDLLVC